MSLCCKIVYKWVTVMDGIKFEFNDIKKNVVYKKRFWVETVCQV